jgi:hypothetical protein
VTAAVRVRTPSPVQDSKVYVAVISAGRAGNVPKMEAHLEGVPHQWVVPQGQEDDYRAMGAADVWGTFSKSAIEALITACELNDAYYAGIAPTNNAYFTRNLYNLNGFIRSALTAYRPGSALRYDHQFPLKGDYDLTCQHLRKFGRVARVDGLLGTFAFGQGAGGCVDYRTPQLEDLVIERLMAKWPGKFKPNPKRPGEVRFRWTKDDVDDSVKPEKNSRVATGQMEMW